MPHDPKDTQVGRLEGWAHMAAFAAHAGVGLGALLALAGFGAPWSSALGGFFQVGGVDLIRMLLADPAAMVRNWGAWNTSQLVMLPAIAALLLFAATLGMVVVIAPTILPAPFRSLGGFFQQGLPLYQLFVAVMLGWGVTAMLLPMLVAGNTSVGAGLPIMLLGAGLSGTAAFGALLACLSQTRAAAQPAPYAEAA